MLFFIEKSAYGIERGHRIGYDEGKSGGLRERKGTREKMGKKTTERHEPTAAGVETEAGVGTGTGVGTAVGIIGGGSLEKMLMKECLGERVAITCIESTKQLMAALWSGEIRVGIEIFVGERMVIRDLLEEREVRLPCELKELEARIEKGLKRHVENLGGCYFFPEEKVIVSEERQMCVVSEKEAQALWLLWSAPEKKLHRKELLSMVWGYGDQCDTHTVETHLYHLRHKLERLGGFVWRLVAQKSTYMLVPTQDFLGVETDEEEL